MAHYSCGLRNNIRVEPFPSQYKSASTQESKLVKGSQILESDANTCVKYVCNTHGHNYLIISNTIDEVIIAIIVSPSIPVKSLHDSEVGTMIYILILAFCDTCCMFSFSLSFPFS